jgi:membrane protease YdiL (CAAX protease family)
VPLACRRGRSRRARPETGIRSGYRPAVRQAGFAGRAESSVLEYHYGGGWPSGQGKPRAAGRASRPASDGSMDKWGRERSSIVELGVLFMPSIPALIWLWPNIRDQTAHYIVQSLAYLYVLAGVLWIGLRRWSWDALRVNPRGFWLSASCGGVVILLRFVAQSALDAPVEFIPFRLVPFAGNFIFYFCFVGFVEELLFRGLLFRALEDWKGPWWAVVGSSAAFAVWHIGWAGPLMIGHFVIGLFLGLVRWRSGSIPGLILVHGLNDFLASQTANPVSTDRILQALAGGTMNIPWIVLGDCIFFGAVIFLVWIYPRVGRGKKSAADAPQRKRERR